mmetsp:Transcript_8664/g.23305  ORF Transcript_8664/g.23305 Transcript_8664/m.23305 type:complete len:93 (+) Transcript_8664:59-337(+)|eukprot:CAMPEP_0113866950 /NCGR_PEP_ID=MMETSP0780_2-20120614/152_1 /TAXON_ID=652834 /ORGANISM="Palpitomonas bilix" /LENGTH=92 /DNA_ID=CAMNT_0000851847 /DNA_START=29 /DNA_END=307 /DNA_ORIENTATION=+ /assembly_acc=CAM_ASM_000599
MVVSPERQQEAEADVDNGGFRVSSRARELVPPVYHAPIMFMGVAMGSRLAFRHRPAIRDKVFYATVGTALVHGFYLIYDSYQNKDKDNQAAK